MPDAIGGRPEPVGRSVQVADCGEWFVNQSAGRARSPIWSSTCGAGVTDRAHRAAWPAGRMHALRPAFRELALPAAAVYEALETAAAPASSFDLATTAGVSRRRRRQKTGPQLAVTGLGDPTRLLRLDAAQPRMPLSLTKPLGIGVLNTQHKATGDVFPEAIEAMTTLNRDASRAALHAGIRAVTDVTGFGLLGHLLKMARASNLTAVIDAAAVPYLAGARRALQQGYVSGGTRRNLDWVRPHLQSTASEDELLLLADAQTSGGLLIAGEIPSAPVIGELIHVTALSLSSDDNSQIGSVRRTV